MPFLEVKYALKKNKYYPFPSTFEENFLKRKQKKRRHICNFLWADFSFFFVKMDNIGTGKMGVTEHPREEVSTPSAKPYTYISHLAGALDV